MSTYHDGAEAVERELVRSQALAELGAKLRELGSLDNQAQSLEKRVAEAGALLATLEPQVKEAQGGIQLAHATAAEITAEAIESAAKLTREADEKAAEKLAAATQEADRVVAQASSKAEGIVAAAQAVRKSAGEAAEAAKQEVRDKMAEKAGVQKDIDELTAKLNALKQRAEDMLR
jgi:molybdopterin-biosynthesis enzyme MoeA-like protein